MAPVSLTTPVPTWPDPAPRNGLRREDFRRVSANGFGDGHNSFPHAMAWLDGSLYVGTTRSNFHMLRVQPIFKQLPVLAWPVEGPEDADGLYRDLDRRAQVWRYEAARDQWHKIHVSPMVKGSTGDPVARETGFRSMAVFQGESDDRPVIYAASWGTSRSPGCLLMRCEDGETLVPVSPYGILDGVETNGTRVLIPFKDRLFTSPTSVRSHEGSFRVNVSGTPVVYQTRDPAHGGWHPACWPGFGDPDNQGVYMLCPFNDQLYAGTFNLKGYQVWRSPCEGKPPYRWTKVIDQGAYRGPLNQATVSMAVFNGALYVGSGIQNGGNDLTNKIGPAGSELIRIHADDSWDLLIGSPRKTPEGPKEALGGLNAGFGNIFNGYFWSLQAHDGWLYLGTCDSIIWMRYLDPAGYPERVQRLVAAVGVERFLEQEGGCDLWRSADGENWMPVTRTGMDNVYNFGVRNMVSAPPGLFVGIANPFGPRVAVQRGDTWAYEDNPRGGLEIWLGARGDGGPDPAT